jgi:hypothetical protein
VDCVGECDGQKRDGCTFPDLTQSCGAPFCEAGVFTNQVCNGQGGCVDATPERCAPYGCDADRTSCADSCTTDSDCATGAACNTDTSQCAFTDDTCVDAFTSESAGGVRTECSPYRCAAGVCQEQCERDGDCADGYRCEDRQCVDDEDPSSSGGSSSVIEVRDGGRAGDEEASRDAGGCGCSVPGRWRFGSAPRASLAILLVALLVLRRSSSRARAMLTVRGGSS